MLCCRHGKAELNCQQITTALARKSIEFFFPFRLENFKLCESERDDRSRSTNNDAITRGEMGVGPQHEEGNLDTSPMYYSDSEERQHKPNSRVTFLLTWDKSQLISLDIRIKTLNVQMMSDLWPSWKTAQPGRPILFLVDTWSRVNFTEHQYMDRCDSIRPLVLWYGKGAG